MVEEILPKYMFVVHKSNFHSMTKRKKRVQGAPNTTQYQLTACQYLDFLGLYPLHKFGRIDEFRRRNPCRAIQIENSCKLLTELKINNAVRVFATSDRGR